MTFRVRALRRDLAVERMEADHLRRVNAVLARDVARARLQLACARALLDQRDGDIARLATRTAAAEEERDLWRALWAKSTPPELQL